MTLEEAYRYLLPASIVVDEESIPVLDIKPETHRRGFALLMRHADNDIFGSAYREALHVYIAHRMDGWPERELQDVDR